MGDDKPMAVKSAERCLDLLELFADHPDGLTLTDVSERTRWPKSSVLGLLRTMQNREFLASGRDSGSYRLGPRVAAIGAAYVQGISLAEEGQAVVRMVSRACDETVHLAVLQGRDVLYIAKEEGGGHMRMVSMVGRMVPAHGTGVGKMLLAMLPLTDLDALYPPGKDLPRLTDKTLTDRDAFMRRLERVREQKYATDDGESTVGVNCLAAPILDVNANVVAAMSISVPEPRFTEDRIPTLFSLLMDGARELSIRMGCPPSAVSHLSRQAASEVAHDVR